MKTQIWWIVYSHEKKEINLPVQETLITKELQKVVLKTICEYPTHTPPEITVTLQNIGKKVSQEEIFQVLYSISPDKNWNRASTEDIKKEILSYVWTLEAQILFLLPTKQKETTIAEFNQMRLQNKQSKVHKDVVRHLQSLLMVDGKNLAKFRKFEKELSYQNDIDPNIQASWALRILLLNLDPDKISSVNEISTILITQFKEKFPVMSEKVGKTIQRLCERLIEKYIPQSITENKVKELLGLHKSIYETYRKGTESESTHIEYSDQNKLINNIISRLKELQENINESTEGGFVSKLFSGKIKNKEQVIKIISNVISSLEQVTDLNSKTNKLSTDKLFLIQKLQSDLENIVMVKSQLESDLYNLNEKLRELEEKNKNIEKELHDKAEALEKAYEKVASLQQRVDTISELETKANFLREELSAAKEIVIRLYSRVNKIKTDLLKQQEKPKNQKQVIIHHSVVSASAKGLPEAGKSGPVSSEQHLALSPKADTPQAGSTQQLTTSTEQEKSQTRSTAEVLPVKTQNN